MHDLSCDSSPAPPPGGSLGRCRRGRLDLLNLLQYSYYTRGGQLYTYLLSTLTTLTTLIDLFTCQAHARHCGKLGGDQDLGGQLQCGAQGAPRACALRHSGARAARRARRAAMLVKEPPGLSWHPGMHRLEAPEARGTPTHRTALTMCRRYCAPPSPSILT